MASSLFPFVRRWALNDAVSPVVINRRGDVFAMALEGGFAFLATDDAGQDPLPLPSGQGTCLDLTADADDHAFLAGSADGALSIIEPGVAVPTILAYFLGQSVTRVASSPCGFRACACGAELHRFDPEGQEIGEKILFPAPIQALAFSPEGQRLAIAHQEGVSVIAAAEVKPAPWTLSPEKEILALAWSPNGQALSALANGKLYGWNAPEEGRTGAPQGRVLPTLEAASAALSFSGDGRFLFVQGLTQPLGWPLVEGFVPGDAAPLVLGEQRESVITFLAPHPRDSLAAIGYADGAVFLAPFDGRREILLFPPVEGDKPRVVGLLWSRDGDCLHMVLGNGRIFLFTLSSVLRFHRGARDAQR